MKVFILLLLFVCSFFTQEKEQLNKAILFSFNGLNLGSYEGSIGGKYVLKNNIKLFTGIGFRNSNSTSDNSNSIYYNDDREDRFRTNDAENDSKFLSLFLLFKKMPKFFNNF